MAERMMTGVAGLDEMLGGGLLPDTCVLVRGAPGAGKTTLGLQFLLHGAAQGEPGLWISFEEFPQSVYRDAESLDWDLRALERQGLLHPMFTSPEVFVRSLETPESPLNRLIVEKGVRRVVLDSVTHFTRLSDEPQALRKLYTATANSLRREGVTALLLGEEQRGGAREREDRGRLAFVVDGVILMRYVEIESAMQRALVVLKLRGSGHAKEIRRYEIRHKDGIVVTGPFERREGLLSGMSRRV